MAEEVPTHTGTNTCNPQQLFDAADLGLSPDDEQCIALAEELGSQPPWPVASLKNYFDSRFPGWDEAPALSLSSPLSRLRVLAQVFPHVGSGGLANDGGHAYEALRELGNEVKHAQIRITCHRGETSLQDECSLLLVIVGQVGDLLLSEREARIHDRETSARELGALRETLRNTTQDAMTAAKEEMKGRLEEFEHEAESQRQEISRLKREMQMSREQENHASNLEMRCESLEQQAVHWKKAHDDLQEEMREVKAQRAALAVAHEESEGAISELTRQLSRSQPQLGGQRDDATEAVAEPIPCNQRSEPPAVTSHGPAPVGRGESFMNGARAALLLNNSMSKELLRPALLAWRCARLEGLYARIGEAAAASSLQADLSMVGANCNATCNVGQGRCCCNNGTQCCQSRWVDAAWNLLLKERAARSSAEALANVSKQRSLVFAISAAVALIFLILAWIEPRLLDVW